MCFSTTSSNGWAQAILASPTFRSCVLRRPSITHTRSRQSAWLSGGSHATTAGSDILLDGYAFFNNDDVAERALALIDNGKMRADDCHHWWGRSINSEHSPPTITDAFPANTTPNGQNNEDKGLDTIWECGEEETKSDMNMVRGLDANWAYKDEEEEKKKDIDLIWGYKRVIKLNMVWTSLDTIWETEDEDEE
ncbi:hypothetical protein SBOR_5846 [Sclerotinia borealis F-4128]|uniref:Uncharacterized protein n=1 Tax=Sclerotinia borealis (strain F-4128) TaxID=1432307 RepID=W9CD48_SCLBF|nr:hypothetical protein SBOR_5846 [Sclerotinia borealis F-4128]